MSVFNTVLRGIILVAVVMVLTTIAAKSFKTLTFAEDEWEDLTESFGAFDSGAVVDPLEEPGPLDKDQDPGTLPDPGEAEEGGSIIPDWLGGIPILGDIAKATAAIALAIWGGILTFVDLAQKGITALLALVRFLFAITTFDIPALNAHPILQLFRVLLALPVWVGIPYLIVRLLRGGG